MMRAALLGLGLLVSSTAQAQGWESRTDSKEDPVIARISEEGTTALVVSCAESFWLMDRTFGNAQLPVSIFVRIDDMQRYLAIEGVVSTAYRWVWLPHKHERWVSWLKLYDSIEMTLINADLATFDLNGFTKAFNSMEC